MKSAGYAKVPEYRFEGEEDVLCTVESLPSIDDFEIEEDPPEDDALSTLCYPSNFSCLLSLLIPHVWLTRFRILRESEAVLALNWGKFAAVKKRPGIYCLNPCGMETKKVSLKRRTMELKDVKLIDCKGNPVIVGGCIFWNIHSVKAALLNVENVDTYIHTAAMAVLKEVVSKYPYEADEKGGQSLKTEAAAVGSELSLTLQRRVCNAGVRIVAFNMTDLSYAPEIAQVMLVKQQAEAMVKARQLIVKGAVDISEDAIQQLQSKGIEMHERDRTRIVSNLLTVICGEQKM